MFFPRIGYNGEDHAYVLRELCYTFLEDLEKDWVKIVQEAKDLPPESSLLD